MTDFNGRGGQNRVLLVLGLVSLTLVALAGIKFMMSENPVERTASPAERQDVFSSSREDAPPPELSPLARSESTSGGSLDMFSKTNAGYYGEDESAATVTARETPEPKVARSTATAARKKEATVKPKTKATVVPRMKMVPFKSITPTNVAPSGAGGQQGMPDLSEMMRKAQEQAGQNGTGD